MLDYKGTYISLFQPATSAIAILREARKNAEEVFMSFDPPVFMAMDSGKPEKDNQQPTGE